MHREAFAQCGVCKLHTGPGRLIYRWTVSARSMVTTTSLETWATYIRNSCHLAANPSVASSAYLNAPSIRRVSC